MQAYHYFIRGLHCDGCVKLMERTIADVSGVIGVQVDLATGRADVQSERDIPFDEIDAVVHKAGARYSLSREPVGIAGKSLGQKIWQYRVLIAIVVISGVFGWMRGEMADFMGAFLVLLSVLQILNLRAFASMFRAYDLIAAKIPAYGWVYPFLGLAAGIAYLAHRAPLPTNGMIILIYGIGAIGVSNALKKQGTIQCACMGSWFQVPLSYVTLIEDALMALMAAFMLGYSLH